MPKSAAKKRTVFRLSFNKDLGEWILSQGGLQMMSDFKKTNLVKRSTCFIRGLSPSTDWNYQLVIHKKDGKIQEERTYGNDPKHHPG